MWCNAAIKALRNDLWIEEAERIFESIKSKKNQVIDGDEVFKAIKKMVFE